MRILRMKSTSATHATSTRLATDQVLTDQFHRLTQLFIHRLRELRVISVQEFRDHLRQGHSRFNRILLTIHGGPVRMDLLIGTLTFTLATLARNSINCVRTISISKVKAIIRIRIVLSL